MRVSWSGIRVYKKLGNSKQLNHLIASGEDLVDCVRQAAEINNVHMGRLGPAS